MPSFLYHVQITTFKGTVFNFPMNPNVRSSPYLLTGIDGLGANINNAFVDRGEQGRLRQGQQAPGRDITLKVRLRPDYSQNQTVSDLRLALYDMMDARQNIPMPIRFRNLENTANLVSISGYVKSIEPVPFSKDADVNITFECLQPNFSAPETTVNLVDMANFGITNVGSSIEGFYLEFTVHTRMLGGFHLYRTGSYPVDFLMTQTLEVNDVFKMSTRFGNRYVNYVRAGVTKSLLTWVTTDSDYIELYPGVNAFQTNWPRTYYQGALLKYTPKYVGL